MIGKILTVVTLSLSAAAYAQTQTHQLRDVTSGHCLTSDLSLKACDGSPGQNWSYEAQTVPAPAPVSLFAPTATPVTVTENDANAVSLGMRFSVAANGTISGMR